MGAGEAQNASSKLQGVSCGPRAHHRHSIRLGASWRTCWLLPLLLVDQRSCASRPPPPRRTSRSWRGIAGDMHYTKISDLCVEHTATPATPTVPELPPNRTPGWVCGIYSTIHDVSSQRSTPGRPAALSDGYGPWTKSCWTGSSFDVSDRIAPSH